MMSGWKRTRTSAVGPKLQRHETANSSIVVMACVSNKADVVHEIVALPSYKCSM